MLGMLLILVVAVYSEQFYNNNSAYLLYFIGYAVLFMVTCQHPSAHFQ